MDLVVVDDSRALKDIQARLTIVEQEEKRQEHTNLVLAVVLLAIECTTPHNARSATYSPTPLIGTVIRCCSPLSTDFADICQLAMPRIQSAVGSVVWIGK